MRNGCSIRSAPLARSAPMLLNQVRASVPVPQ
jgi:hypothetical protein